MFRKPTTIQKCPVCNSVLGERNKTVFFMAECYECKFFFSWEPGADKPKASKPIKESKKCTCASCRALGR